MYSTILQIKTSKFFDIIDLTDDIKRFLKKISAKNGFVNIYTRHTTVCIKINEKEEGFFKDLHRIVFENIANPKEEYHHNDMHARDPETICPTAGGEDCKNGHSHVAQMLLGSASETIPVSEGEMLLGRWQRVLMFELDRERTREIVISFINGGENNEMIND